MLKNYLNEELIELDVDVNDAEEAISYAGNLLVKNNKVKAEYIKSMIDTLHEFGAYMVIAKGIAIPHGRPGNNVFEDCISFVRLKKPINFGNKDNDPVSMIFAIAGKDAGSHLDFLKELSLFLMDENNIEKIMSVQSKKEFLGLIEKGEK